MSQTKFILAVIAIAVITAYGNSLGQPVNNNSHPNPQEKNISGTVIYRERVALPPNATVRVVLEEVSQANDRLLWRTIERKAVNLNNPLQSVALMLHRAAFQQEQSPSSKQKPTRSWVFECDNLVFSAVSDPGKIHSVSSVGPQRDVAPGTRRVRRQIQGKGVTFLE